MKRHHIERLLKNRDLGTQILFEHRLEEWRKALDLPLGYQSGDNFSLYQPNNTERSASPCSRPSSSSTTNRFTPYSRMLSPIPAVCVTLATILNESSRGTMIVDYYNKFGKFQDYQRTMLISLIAAHYQEKGVKMSLVTSHKLESEILERFPSEKLVSLF